MTEMPAIIMPIATENFCLIYSVIQEHGRCDLLGRDCTRGALRGCFFAIAASKMAIFAKNTAAIAAAVP